MDDFRAPLDESAFAAPVGGGLFRPEPTPIERRTLPPEPAVLEALGRRAIRDALRRTLVAVGDAALIDPYESPPV